ncbi:MAG: trypsin-like peptidase domain-containing protein [Microcystaceae cyanobacterium]
MMSIARIFHGNGAVVGAGFLVSSRYLLTCAHVIQQALGLQETTVVPQDTVKLDLPSCPNLTAKVVYWQPCSSNLIAGAGRGEDIAALKIIEDLPPHILPVNLSQVSIDWGQEVRLFGFPENYDNGLWVRSVLRNSVFNGWIQMDQITLGDRIIERGFSGTPVWYREFNGVGNGEFNQVIGMAVASDLGRSLNVNAVCFAIPSSILINPCLKLLQLLEILSSWDSALFKVIKEAYVNCRRQGLERPVPETLEEIIKDFADEARLNLDKDKMSLDLDKFVLCLIVDSKVAESSSFELLTQWGREYIKDFKKVLKQEKERDKRRRNLPKSQESLTYLMIRLTSKQFSDKYEISAVFIPDKSQYKASENRGIIPLQINPQDKDTFPLKEIHQLLPSILEDLLDQSSQYPAPDSPQIIFFLPHALFAEPFETIRIQDEDELLIPLRAEYRVIFRSEKRLQKKYRHRIKWENNWKKIQNCYQQSCCHHFKSDCDCESWEDIFFKLEAEAMGIAMTKNPSQEKFKVFDRVGIPIAIWAKQILESWNYQQELDALLKCSIEELPEQIQQKHREAFRQFPQEPEKHVGHHLTLLWEDPYLLPAHIDYSTP